MRMTDLIYKDLCYKIVGILYRVHNELGGGHREKYYHRAVEIELKKEKLTFKSELFFPLSYQGKIIGKYYLDFLIDDKVIVELKSGEFFKKNDIDQVYHYLQTSKLKLGLLVNFTKHKVRYKRVLNIS